MWTSKATSLRESPKYYGDLRCNSKSNSSLCVSLDYVAYNSADGEISYLPTDFSAASQKMSSNSKRAEYGSKEYTTKSVSTLKSDDNINALLFSKFNSGQLFSAHDSGIVNCWQLTQSQQPFFSISEISIPQVLCQHPCTADVLIIGTNDGICMANLSKKGMIEQQMECDSVVVGLSFIDDGSAIYGITDDSQLLLFDPRSGITSDAVLMKDIACIPNYVTSIDDHRILIGGLTAFKDPVLQMYDRRKLSSSTTTTNTMNFNHKNCVPIVCFDSFLSSIYVSFKYSHELLCISLHNQMEQVSQYQCADDESFLAFDVQPKYACTRREINRIFKLTAIDDDNNNSNNNNGKLQLLTHTMAGKLIYHKIADKTIFCSPLLTFDAYFTNGENASYIKSDLCKQVSQDFEEQKERKYSRFQHIIGIQPQQMKDKYFGIRVAPKCTVVNGKNAVSNTKYVVFPAPTLGGGSLGVISTQFVGRVEQMQIKGHSEDISTFDICKMNGYENDIVTGAGDCKAILWRIHSDTKLISQICTMQHSGRVTYVAFHPRICQCIISGARTLNGCAVYLWDMKNNGKCIKTFICVIDSSPTSVFDVSFEPVYGLLMAVALPKGVIQIFDIKHGTILLQFTSECMMRESSVHWLRDNDDVQYLSKLMTLGFTAGSVRKFAIYDTSQIVREYYENALHMNSSSSSSSSSDSKVNDDDDEENEVKVNCIVSKSLGVSNSIPIGYYDMDTNLLFVSSVGGRKILVFELNLDSSSDSYHIKEIRKAILCKDSIISIPFAFKQHCDVSEVEIAKCFTLSKDSISMLSLRVPRKRKEYFQDDIFDRLTLDLYSSAGVLSLPQYIQWINNHLEDSSNPPWNVIWISVQPSHMQLLSEAPAAKLTNYQKKRKSLLVEQENRKVSAVHVLNQFARAASHGNTQNRWDATPVDVNEVDDDEWSD